MKATRINEMDDVVFFSPDTSSSVLLPLAQQEIPAGFPSPADDYLEEQIDLNKELIRNPTSTFLGRVKGTSMAPWTDRLTDDEIVAVAHYVRQFFDDTAAGASR